MKTSNRDNGFNILSLDDDFAEYCKLFSRVANSSVYLLPSYLKSVQYAEKCPCHIMLFSENDNFALMAQIKRRINDLAPFRDLDSDYWDFIAPHEYSTVLSNCEEPETKNKLSAKLLKSAGDYCRSQNVISEFIRFDPFLADTAAMESFYDVKVSCRNIYIDLRRSMNEIIGSFHSSVKKNLKKSADSSLSFFPADKTDGNIEIFIKLYWSSMDRLAANNYFYFSREYFYNLIKECEGASLFIVNNKDNQPIAASILLHHGHICHHHLTGYNSGAINLRPNDFMIYSLIQWGQAHHLDYLHLGGGAPSICKFKKKFSPAELPYYIGKRVHNQELYQQLCHIRQKEPGFPPNSNYFPLYRAGS